MRPYYILIGSTGSQGCEYHFASLWISEIPTPSDTTHQTLQNSQTLQQFLRSLYTSMQKVQTPVASTLTGSSVTTVHPNVPGTFGGMGVPMDLTKAHAVTVWGRGLIFSIVHLLPLTIDSPFTFTILIIFFTDTFRYIVWWPAFSSNLYRRLSSKPMTHRFVPLPTQTSIIF